MNFFDIERIALRSGLLLLGEDEAQKFAFLHTFGNNLQREIDEEKEDEFRKTGRWDIWED